ncbi:MAG: hypothetical protein HQM16_12885 [Deltaproteobacteria bacterium]|nr:hypothetical protein [Deltaproteobacteria bacterium]
MNTKRTRFVVTPKVQYKIIFVVCLSFIIPAIFLGISVLYNFKYIEGLLTGPIDLLEAAIEDTIAAATMVLCLGIPAMIGLIILWTILITNRIAGPIYRLEKELDEIIATRQYREISFRKDDAFHSLAEKINTLQKGVLLKQELPSEFKG